MSYKRFGSKDLVFNTLVAKPEFNFIIHSGNVFLQKERPSPGNFSNLIKHVPSGNVSLYEINVNRPSGSMAYSYINKNSTRYSYKSVSTSQFDDVALWMYGDVMRQDYPMSASISKIYIPEGPEFDQNPGTPNSIASHANKKYIRALKNAVNSPDRIGQSNTYGKMGEQDVNLVCVPGIFYGSSVDKGSIQLDYYLSGTLVAQARDSNADGRLIQVSGNVTHNNTQIGAVLYNQGILILTASHSLHATHTDKFLSSTASVSPSWLSFATGAPQVGTALTPSISASSSYSINFKGVNKIPTLTMFAYSELGEHNYSHNPTFVSGTEAYTFGTSSHHFSEKEMKSKEINKSPYSDNRDDFKKVTYISKVGIYDKNKNLIAIASLAKPVKKTEKRDFMFKLKMDF